MVPNKEGKLTDVILGLMNADEYLADDAKFVFCNFHLETPFHNILVNILIMPHLGLHSK